ncbi:hypothetical protein C064_00495 [Brucella suis 63/252]|nr:hypothetical protein DO78_716 [Brucella abortus]AIJ60283.1 hypothetical protein DK53_795 [Brucella abortus bv. 9 str. C68]AIJ63714.1 hypothetical protein DO74_1078 [Brucella abortus bv. 6 str. 870]AIJ71934.1 hypothetical protein DK67_1703 [Brucella suis bv. 3 str. 686]AIJ73988.1 hypothetical protein DK65_571 [Brucella pinnipedialis]ALM34233.1 hypothetical protein BME20236_I0773 [Brucella melitensis]ENP33184.1 hypothetical protein C084_00650 [Brucella abortus 64/122]ENP45215.1 hypothetical
MWVAPNFRNYARFMLRAKINKGYSVIVELINLARVVGSKIRTGSVILACSPKNNVP